ncbi:hypothetical protein JTB14_005550 [Gonioctena quinquepunctata]|nr:hypothetical protein JTB14_005550 [Gonioctena quinquepunctata]
MCRREWAANVTATLQRKRCRREKILEKSIESTVFDERPQGDSDPAADKPTSTRLLKLNPNIFLQDPVDTAFTKQDGDANGVLIAVEKVPCSAMRNEWI